MDLIKINAQTHAKPRTNPWGDGVAGNDSMGPPDATGIVFSVGGVLFDDSIWKRWLLQQLARIGLQTQYQAFFQVLESEYLPDVYCGRRDYWHALREYLFAVGLNRGQIDEVEATAAHRRLRFEREIHPMPGVRGTLSILASRGVPMAVLCNSIDPTPQLVTKLQALGIAQHFHHVGSSQDAGVALPASESYQLSIQALQAKPTQLIFVSNDQREIRGARAVGMIGVAMHLEPFSEGNYCLDRIDTLTTMVRPCASRPKAA